MTRGPWFSFFNSLPKSSSILEFSEHLVQSLSFCIRFAEPISVHFSQILGLHILPSWWSQHENKVGLLLSRCNSVGQTLCPNVRKRPQENLCTQWALGSPSHMLHVPQKLWKHDMSWFIQHYIKILWIVCLYKVLKTLEAAALKWIHTTSLQGTSAPWRGPAWTAPSLHLWQEPQRWELETWGFFFLPHLQECGLTKEKRELNERLYN